MGTLTAAAASAVVAAASETLVASTGAAVAVAVARPVTALTRLSNSRRTKASSDHASGGSAGEVEPAPMNGLSAQFTTLDTMVPSTWSGFCGAAAGAAGVTSTVATCVTVSDVDGVAAAASAVTAEAVTVSVCAVDFAAVVCAFVVVTATDEVGAVVPDVDVDVDVVLAAPPPLGLGVVTGSAAFGSELTGSLTTGSVTTGSETGSGAAGVFVVEVLLEVPVVLWALTTTPLATVVVVFEDVREEDGVSAALDAEPEPVSEPAAGDVVGSAVETVSLTGPVPSSEAPDDGEPPEVLEALELEELVDEVSSAAATPYPVATAVPTPSATAKPPTRPMYLAAPMLPL